MAAAISVIIVNYNGRHLLGECLDSLREQTFRDFETIVVDNASTDGSVEFVKENYPEIVVIRNKANLGYGGGNNAGIRVSKGRYSVFLNNDTRVDPLWLQRLYETAEKDKKTGMCASRIMNYYQPGIFDNTGLLLYRDGIARGRGRLERDVGQYDSEEEVFFPSGCAALYSRAMLDEIGLFDEDFFLYLDDVDIGLRGRLAGWKCVYVPGAVVYHKYSATTDPYSPLKALLVERNRLWIVIKYFPLRMILASPFHTLVRYVLQGYGVLSGRGAGSRMVKSHSAFGSIKILFRAYLSAGRAFGRILGKRREMKKLRTVDDTEIADWLRRFGIGAKEVSLKE